MGHQRAEVVLHFVQPAGASWRSIDQRRFATAASCAETRPCSSVDSLLLIDQPANETTPRCINVYSVEVEDIYPASAPADHGKRFEVGPDKLMYAVRWKHKGSPPDLDLTLAPPFKRGVELWFDYCSAMLLGADPELRERIIEAAATP